MQTMFSSRNIILTVVCSSIFLMSAYFVFLKPAKKSADLTETYLNFIDTIDKHRLDSIYVHLTINSLSSNSGFNYCGTAGYSGERIPIINPTPLFQNSLSESQIITLCEQSGPVVKHFAFKALCKINFESAKKVFEKQISDTSLLSYQCGCIGTPVSINLDFLNTIRDKITNMETVSYLQRIKPRLSPFIFKSTTEFFSL
jgi:hypothetical protein